MILVSFPPSIKWVSIFIILFLVVLVVFRKTPVVVYADPPPPCPWTKPTVDIRKVSRQNEVSAGILFGAEVDFLKVKAKKPNLSPTALLEFDSNIEILQDLNESFTQQTYFKNKGETVSLITNLLCSYWDLSYHPAIDSLERLVWKQKYCLLVNDLQQFILPSSSIAADSSCSTQVSDPKLLYAVISGLEFKRTDKRLYLKGTATWTKAIEQQQLIWVFIERDGFYFSKGPLTIEKPAKEWELDFPVDRNFGSTGALLVKVSDPTVESRPYGKEEISQFGTIIDEESIDVPPPPSCTGTKINSETAGASGGASGSICAKDFDPSSEVLWLFVNQADGLYYSKDTSYPSISGDNWNARFKLQDLREANGFSLLKFPKKNLSKLETLGYAGYNREELIVLGGKILHEMQIPPST